MSGDTNKRRAYDEQLRAAGAHLEWRVEETVPFCWMCDRTTGRRAKEHVFPRWLLGELNADDERFHPTHQDLFGRPISGRGPIPASAFVAGEICAECNGGWMSHLEGLARAVLFPPGGRDVLDVHGQHTLARWLIKTSVVLNTSQNYRLMIPKLARHKVASGIPRDFGVYIARHRQVEGQLNFAQTAGGVISVVPQDRMDAYKAAAKRVYCCGLAIGDLLGVVVYSPPGAWAMPTERMARIWPPDRPAIAWGELPDVSDMTDPMHLAGLHPDFTVEGATNEEWERAWREGID